MTASSRLLQQGFSLIELVTVLLIITVLSTIAIRSTVDIGYSARYEQTRERLNSLRQAIVGNPKRSINGQPDISGFVADMGRLPINVRELISSDPFCIDPDYGDDVSDDATYGTSGLCTGAGYTWHQITGPNAPVIGEGYIKAGWRGPYLQVNDVPASTSTDIFPDGWGNEINTEAAFEHFYDYGWYWCHWVATDDVANSATANNLPDDLVTENGFPNCNVISLAGLENLSIYSLAKNGVGDVASDGSVTCGDNEYDDDCYTTILEADYKVELNAGISVAINTEYDSHPFCGFPSTGTYATQPECENAGGSWGGPCTLDVTSCKTVGGLWQSCFLSSSDCTQAGGTRSTICKFTQNSCTALTGAVWVAPNCSITTNVTDCTSAGGTWSGTACIFDEQQCANAGGVSLTQCTFANSTDCTNASGTWETSVYNSCTFTQANCNTNQGHSLGSDCYMSHAENTGALYSGSLCDAQSEGDWVNQICLIIFYRDPNTSAITPLPSNPIDIDEMGVNQTFVFDFTTPPDIPIGINSIAVYEYDGDCDAANAYYPSDRTQPMQVIFKPRASLPTFNW